MTSEIAKLNDTMRRTFFGRVVFTSAFAWQSDEWKTKALTAIREFDNFNLDNDPHNEHDFVRVEIDGVAAIAKFDYYQDDKMEYGAESGLCCYRVLTIMLASDY